MKKIKVGIIGTGFGADVHAPIFQSHDGFEVKAITSVHRRKLNEALLDIGVNKIYTDWNEMIKKEELDLVSIASIPKLHSEMTLVSIDRNIHVLCEKPMGINSEQTLKMLEAQRASDVMGFVNFQWRLTPVRLKIKEIIRNKELGEIQYIKYQGSFSGYQSLTSQYRGWEGKKKDGGGLLFGIGSHMIDSLMWWMDQKIVDVYADLRTLVPIYNGINGIEERDADDAFTIIGHFQNGVSFTADLFYPALRGNGWKLEIYGTKGSLVMNNDEDIMISFGEELHNVTIERKETPSQLPYPADQYFNGLYPMMDLIYNSIINNVVCPNTPTFTDGHQVQLVMDAIYRSVQNNALTQVMNN